MTTIKMPCKTCPRCGKQYIIGCYPILMQNDVDVCEECGIRESLENVGITEKKAQDHVLNLMKIYNRNHGRD